jgi:hypothetical protein
MPKASHFLIASGVISALIAIFHVILVLRPELYAYVAPGQGDVLSQMAEQGSTLTTIATITLAIIFAIWAIYAFSGAGLLPQQPLLRPLLIAIAVIYILRGLFLLTEIKMVLEQGYALRFVLFSSLSLVTGLLYLVGTLGLPRK